MSRNIKQQQEVINYKKKNRERERERNYSKKFNKKRIQIEKNHRK